MITSILRKCANCSISLDPETHNQLCSLCWAMLEAVSTPYFRLLHREWLKENMARLMAKDRCLNRDLEQGDENAEA